MAKSSYEKKKKDLAAKGMPNPSVKKNVTGADRKTEMGKKLHLSSKKGDLFDTMNKHFHK